MPNFNALFIASILPSAIALNVAVAGATGRVGTLVVNKLLATGHQVTALVRNAYLEREMESRAAPLLRVCTAYGATGVVPVDEIEAIVRKLGLRKPKPKREECEMPSSRSPAKAQKSHSL